MICFAIAAVSRAKLAAALFAEAGKGNGLIYKKVISYNRNLGDYTNWIIEDFKMLKVLNLKEKMIMFKPSSSRIENSVFDATGVLDVHRLDGCLVRVGFVSCFFGNFGRNRCRSSHRICYHWQENCDVMQKNGFFGKHLYSAHNQVRCFTYIGVLCL